MQPDLNPYQPPRSELEQPATPTDFTEVASCATATEAHLLKGVLGAAGVEAVVADANLAQVQLLVGPSVTGVRVLVPRPALDEARQVVADYRAGQFELESDEPAVSKPAAAPLAQPVYSPDGLTLWSLALTPAFGTLLKALERPPVGTTGASLWAAWAWFVASAAGVVAMVLWLPAPEPEPWLLFRAALLLWPLTLAWYFFVGHPASRHLVAAHGPHYPRRPLKPAGLATAALLALAGWVITAAR